MARIEQHGAWAFFFYYIIWVIWKGSFLISGGDRYLVLFVVFFGILPDLDVIPLSLKLRKKQEDFEEGIQHHLCSMMHYPLTYTPFLIAFILSLSFNFYPAYFLAPVIGIYGGHLLVDTVASGDGIMWLKIPWKKHQYTPFINLWARKTDGYHGLYWEARYRQTVMNKLGNSVLVLNFIIIGLFQVQAAITHLEVGTSPGISGYYITPLILFFLSLYHWRKRTNPRFMEEPPGGRYQDFRIDKKYIR